MKKITIGMIGSGFAATIHANAYKRVYGLDIYLKSIASLDKKVSEFANRFSIKNIYSDYLDILRDPEIDVVDIVTPPFLHAQMIFDSFAYGKHVICEKPLTAACETEKNGKMISKYEMFHSITEDMTLMRDKILASGLQFMYAENWIYFPSVEKSETILSRRNGKILMIKAEESHSGSHAAHSAYWRYNGGGSLIRQGCHPLSAAIYLKMQEGKRNGIAINVESVIADVSTITQNLDNNDLAYIDARPVDVEDNASISVSFTDGTKANIIATDIAIGGVRNSIEIFSTNSVIQCNVAPNPEMQGYFADDYGMNDIYLTEKIGNKTGWQFVASNDDVVRGYHAEIQDFMECVANKRMPRSGFRLAYETIRTIYAAYASAESNQRVYL